MLQRTLFFLIISSALFLIGSCGKENLPPTARFTISPEEGNDETIFQFDASGTTDEEDRSDALLVRWDWEGDNEFDTQYTTKKTADHKFAPGNYRVTLLVSDSRGLQDTATLDLHVASSNLPPESPENPSPSLNEEETGIHINLSWDCTDPDGDMILYTLYFGTTNPPELYRTAHAQTSFNPGPLVYQTTYYWKILARDSKGNTTEGPIWSFSTLNLNFGEITDSRDGQKYTTIEAGNQWWMAENLNFQTTNSYCYENSESNCAKYGRLYTWEDALIACPTGWHLPSKQEFEELINYFGGMDEAGGKLKDYESNYWREPNRGATNRSGFGALPAGRRYDHGLFTGSGYYAQFYSSTEYQSTEAYNLTLGYDYSTAFVYNYKKKYAISVRCVRD